VGFRQEASRLGGIGSCGRELCCSTWLTDFRSVNTSAARYQQLSLNPQKLAGQCGKLKCCLNYELDTYLDALKGMPDMDTKIYTEKGDAVCQKVDIFKGLMWFAYLNDMAHWHIIKAEQVKEMVTLNKNKERVTALEDYAVEVAAIEPEKNFQNAVGQDSLTRFDAPKHKKRRPNNNNKGGDGSNKIVAKSAAVTEGGNKIVAKNAAAPAQQGSNIIKPANGNQNNNRNNNNKKKPSGPPKNGPAITPNNKDADNKK